MKILSYNICGIKPAIKKGLINFIINGEYDIVCLSEIKLSKIDDKHALFEDLDIENTKNFVTGCIKKNKSIEKNMLMDCKYHVYFNESTIKYGYSGTCVLTKIKPKKIYYGLYMKETKQDDEGRLIILEYNNFILINTYFPNSGEGLKFADKREIWDKEFFSFIIKVKMKNKPLIIAGDMNVAYLPDDIYDGPTNQKRKSMAGYTINERYNFKTLLNLQNLFDVWIEKNAGMKKNKYTFWGRNTHDKKNGWRLDYFLVTKNILGCIQSMINLYNVEISDHSPIILDIDL